MSKNKNIDYDLIIKVIQNELVEVMEADYNYYKDYNVKISREQFFIEENDKGKNNIYITVRFGQSDVNFGQSVLPLTFTVMAEQTSMQVCQDLLYSFAETFDLKRVENDTILQIYTAPQITTNFYEVFTGFKNIFVLSGTFVISQNANIYTLSFYDDSKLAIKNVNIIGGDGTYQPIASEETFLAKMQEFDEDMLENIKETKKPVTAVFDYKPLIPEELKNQNLNNLINLKINEVEKFATAEAIGVQGGIDIDVDRFEVAISQRSKEENAYDEDSVTFNNNFEYTINHSLPLSATSEGYYYITYEILVNSTYSNKGLSRETVTGHVVAYVQWNESSASLSVTTARQDLELTQIVLLVNSTFANSWEMTLNNTVIAISDIEDYGFNLISTSQLIPSKIIIDIYLKLAELEKYDYNIPFITSIFSGNFQLDTQAFYNNNNFTESQTQVGTRTLSITTFLLDDIQFSNKVLDMVCEEISVNTEFYMSVNYRSGKTYYGVFKVANFTQQENIGEIPVFNITLTN